MGVETYTVQYIADPTSFVAGSRQVEQALMRVEAQSARTKKEVSGFAGGAGRSASSASKNVDKLTASLNGVPSAANQAKSSLAGIGVSARGAASGVEELILKSQMLNGAREVFQGVLQMSKEIEQHWKKMAEEAAEFRESLRELAFIRDKTGPDDNVVADVREFSLATGMMPDQAREFSESYENIGPTVRAKGHYQPTQGTKEQLEKDIVTEAGKTAERVGLKGKAASEAIGVAGLAHTFTSVEQAMDIYGGAIKGLTDGKLDVNKGVQALSKVSAKLVDPKEAAEAGALPGRISSFDESAIYLGAMSLGTGTADQAGHRMIQNSRVLNPASDEGRKALAGAGVTPQMNDAQRLIALSRYFKKNKVQDVQGWLRDNKMGSVATREGFEASLKEAEQLDQRLKANKANPAGKKTIEDNEKFRATDPASGSRRAKTVEAVVGLVEGQQAEPLERAKKFAESRRRMGDPSYHNAFDQWSRATIGLVVGYMNAGVGGEGWTNERDRTFGAIPNLKAEGAKYGVDVSKQFPGVESSDYQTRARAFKAAADEVQAKSGGKADPYGQRKAETESRARNNQMRPAAPAADAPAGGGNGAAGAAAPGQKVASIDVDKFDRAVGQLADISKSLGAAARYMANGKPLPGADLGGSYAPYIA